MVDLKVFGRNIEHHAFMQNMKMKDLAADLGIAPEVIRRLRHGKSVHLSVELLNACCKYFEVTPNDLLLRREDLSYPDDYTY